MKRSNGLWIGVIFILLGFLYACNALGILQFSIFFPGWWTLFIIVPCAYGLLQKERDKTAYMIGLLIGIYLFINAQNFSFHIDFWPMVAALVCIAIGIKMIFPKDKNQKQVEFTYNTGMDEDVETERMEYDTQSRQDTKNYSYNTGTANSYLNINAILGGKEVRVEKECFSGAEITAIMGAVELNLKNAIILEDVYIHISAIMGGVDIYVPANVRVVTDSCNVILGGVDVHQEKGTYYYNDGYTPRIILTGNCIMGGIDIK